MPFWLPFIIAFGFMAVFVYLTTKERKRREREMAWRKKYEWTPRQAELSQAKRLTPPSQRDTPPREADAPSQSDEPTRSSDEPCDELYLN